MTKEKKIEKAVRKEVNKMLDENVSPEVDKSSDINSGFCLYFAENVEKRLRGKVNVQIMNLTLMNSNHYWIKYNKKHYDSEAIKGVDKWRELPFWSRLNIDLSDKRIRSI